MCGYAGPYEPETRVTNQLCRKYTPTDPSKKKYTPIDSS